MNQDPTCSEQLTRRILARAVELDHIRSAQYGGASPVATVVLMRVTILGWGLSSLLGSLAAAVHVQLRRTAANTGAGDNEDTRVPLKQRIAAKLKHWIDIWARRSDVQPITEDRAPHATPAH